MDLQSNLLREDRYFDNSLCVLSWLYPLNLQNRAKDVQMKEDKGGKRVQRPWIPPGKPSCRRDEGSYRTQVSLVIRTLSGTRVSYYCITSSHDSVVLVKVS